MSEQQRYLIGVPAGGKAIPRGLEALGGLGVFTLGHVRQTPKQLGALAMRTVRPARNERLARLLHLLEFTIAVQGFGLAGGSVIREIVLGMLPDNLAK